MTTRFIQTILLLTIILSVSFNANSQTKKGKQAKATESTEETITFRAPAPAPQANGSLFSEQSNGLVSDFKPRGVGDLVFVDVVEISAAGVSSGAQRSRDSGAIGGVGNAVGAIPIAGAAATASLITAMGKRTFEGDGSTQRQSRLRARIVARVIEVLPNGDLRIVAEKLVKINKEDEKLILSGIVRTRDVNGDNSVPSTAVGELRVALNGKGVASADNGPGWLFRFLDKITPF